LTYTNIFMPRITVGLFSGRPQMDEARLAEATTEDVANIIKVQQKDSIIVLQEATHGNWSASGIRH
jgi:phenylpyruvate tautomerase PptA (4-oxalocrotonate tautomerase family)